MQIRDQTLDSMLEVPAVEVRDLIEEDSAPRAFRRRGLVLSNQIQNALRAGEDVGVDRRLLVQLEHLRHITDDEITPLIELARIGFHHARRDLEKRRFPRAIAPNQSHTFPLENRGRRLIEHHLVSETHHEPARAGHRIQDRFRHPCR
jgi:hypothetical protein